MAERPAPPETGRPLRLGLIGLAGYGGTYFRTLEGRGGVTVAAVCDANPDVLRNAQKARDVGHAFRDYRELIAAGITDAVCIATPHFLHYPMALSALRSGQHVFCEKPLTITAAHSDELAAEARGRGLVLTCHYNQRTTDYVATLRHLVRTGVLGSVYHVRAEWLARHTGFMFDPATTWRLSREKSGGGIFIGRGSHLIDAALHILDFPPVEAISATTAGRLSGGEVDDFAEATLRLAGGATVTVEATYLAHLPDPAERLYWRVLGDRGGAEFTGGGATPPRLSVGACASPGAGWSDLTPQIDTAAARAAAPTSLLLDFLDAIRDRRDPFVTGEQAALVTRLLEAGYRSADSGREVYL